MNGPEPGEERLFDWREVFEARDWALAGGIAIHYSVELQGEVIGGRRRYGPAFHVFGLEEVLLEWGRRHALRRDWLQPGEQDWPPHFDVFGTLARQYKRRLRQVPQ